MKIKNSQFSKNFANIGGGMRFVGKKPIMEGVTFTDNKGFMGGDDSVEN